MLDATACEHLPRWATVAESARHFGVSMSTARRLVDRGEWPTIRVGGGIRIDREELYKRLGLVRDRKAAKLDERKARAELAAVDAMLFGGAP